MKWIALLLFTVSAFAADKTYPIKLNIVSSDSISSTSHSSTPETFDCNSSTLGNNTTTRCDSYGGTESVSASDIVQTAEGSDGLIYVLECASGVLSGFGEGMQAASGHVERGCMIKPGEYEARMVRGGFKMLVHNSDGKSKELAMRVISVRKKDQ